MGNRKLPPAPFKLATWKTTTGSWADADLQISDLLENPITRVEQISGLPWICTSDPVLRDHIHNHTTALNNMPELDGTGCKYFLHKGGITTERGGAWVLHKLANAFEVFRAAGGVGYHEEEILETGCSSRGRDGSSASSTRSRSSISTPHLVRDRDYR
ncbi:hypothetical protein TWF225_002818 [Orbilia oligospora]|uniref:Uncharacterized protein n=1 Tax=Orbilia oligospora TaxID=2813651 RepID=A0A7C8KID4_ORBOL|nr:hypothetical protein TWF751_003995 [Orbilia oligospora]KAF3189683.1 hypothetical protein TWF225_002818 [Orbilia oligospora]KAF3249386.1 hypothetical protein TWF128_007817 [Orbilia oligospora]KAF3263819.1 hypothetical protein TWF217_003526 [Orbilia oligospora]KAF3297941.1 hypothetical protein TWF132_004085 [Orbilia oligospora]